MVSQDLDALDPKIQNNKQNAGYTLKFPFSCKKKLQGNKLPVILLKLEVITRTYKINCQPMETLRLLSAS